MARPNRALQRCPLGGGFNRPAQDSAVDAKQVLDAVSATLTRPPLGSSSVGTSSTSWQLAKTRTQRGQSPGTSLVRSDAERFDATGKTAGFRASYGDAEMTIGKQDKIEEADVDFPLNDIQRIADWFAIQ